MCFPAVLSLFEWHQTLGWLMKVMLAFVLYYLKCTRKSPLAYSNQSFVTISSKNCFLFQYWDFKGGYELSTQYKTGYTVFTTATLLALLLASAAYF
jgi:hypothetical protein